MQSLVVLITGASSGIGFQTALALRDKGAIVYAAARRAMPTLEGRGVVCRSVDVTDEAALEAWVQEILEREGRIDVLINNAGYGSYGTIEDVPLAQARRQFEVNVFGAMRLTQLVLPQMISQGRGRIVNISSMGGRFSMALGGWYHATKYAIEALSDALRQEVRPFGVDVVIIEPGLVHTDWIRLAANHLRTASGLGKYSAIAQNFAAALEFGGGIATDPAVIAGTVSQAVTTARPRTRYRKGLGALPLTIVTPLLPDRLLDAMVRFAFSHIAEFLDLIRTTET